MQNSKVQYSQVQYSIVQYNTAQYITIQYSVAQYNTLQRKWHSTAQYSAVQYTIRKDKAYEVSNSDFVSKKNNMKSQIKVSENDRPWKRRVFGCDSLHGRAKTQKMKKVWENCKNSKNSKKWVFDRTLVSGFTPPKVYSQTCPFDKS